MNFLIQSINIGGRSLNNQQANELAIKNLTYKMANYYDTADFEIFKPYFDEDISIEKFVESLNYVCDDTNVDKTLEVCEFMTLMKDIREVNKKLSERLINLMNSNENNTYSVYIYLKFLLSSIEDKEKFMTYIDKLGDINQCFCDYYSNEPLDKVLRMMYNIYEDEYMKDFIDYVDTFGEYRLLNTSQHDNLLKCNPDYLKDNFIMNFISSIRFFLRIRIVIQIIYFISDKNKTKILNEGEKSITPLEDFIRRFEKNIDTFTIFYNFTWLKYDTNKSFEDLKFIVAQIPCDKIIQDRYENNYINSNLKDILYIIRYRLFTTILVEQKHYGKEIYTYNSYIEKFSELIEMFLMLKYDYNIKQDNYNIFRYLKYNKTHSDLLLRRYNDYFKSKLYQSLKNIHIVKAKLSSVTTCDKFNITQKEREELYQFLGGLLSTYNYCGFFRYNIICKSIN